jgi:hypothetical protein
MEESNFNKFWNLSSICYFQKIFSYNTIEHLQNIFILFIRYLNKLQDYPFICFIWIEIQI